MIARRTFVTAVTGAALGLRTHAAAHTASARAKVAWLTAGARATLPASRAAIVDGLKEHGFAESDVGIDVNSAGGGASSQYGELAHRIVSGRPDVIVASNPYSIAAVVKATRTIPVVAIDLESDPVARGWVSSIARPGGNLTGFFLDVPELSGKQLQFLREIKPDLALVAVLGAAEINELQFRATRTAAKMAGLNLHPLTITSPAEIEGRVAEAARQRAGALLALTSPMVSSGIAMLAEATIKHRLPAICPFVPRFTEAGGLIAYGPDFYDLFRRAGSYVGRILKGAKVGELPVQRPEKFELAINVKAAKTLGLTLPITLVQRADRLVE